MDTFYEDFGQEAYIEESKYIVPILESSDDEEYTATCVLQ